MPRGKKVDGGKVFAFIAEKTRTDKKGNCKGVSIGEIQSEFGIGLTAAAEIAKKYAKLFIFPLLAKQGIHVEHMQVNLYFLTRRVNGKNVYEHIIGFARQKKPVPLHPTARLFGYSQMGVANIINSLSRNPKNKFIFRRLPLGGASDLVRAPEGKTARFGYDEKKYFKWCLSKMPPDMSNRAIAQKLGVSDNSVARYRKNHSATKTKTPKRRLK